MLVVHPKNLTPEIVSLGKIAGIDEIVVTWSPVEPDVPGLISELFGGGNTLRAIRAIVFFAGAAECLPNLERAANFLEDLPVLWLHPRVTHEEREALVRQVFLRTTIDGTDFSDIEPKPEYTPLLLPSGITVSGVESWIRKLADVA